MCATRPVCATSLVCATSPVCDTSPYAVLALCTHTACCIPADGLSSDASQNEASQREGDGRAARASGENQPRDPTGNQGLQYALPEYCLAS